MLLELYSLSKVMTDISVLDILPQPDIVVFSRHCSVVLHSLKHGVDLHGPPLSDQTLFTSRVAGYQIRLNR